jgi:hypothetical protein
VSPSGAIPPALVRELVDLCERIVLVTRRALQSRRELNRSVLAAQQKLDRSKGPGSDPNARRE